MRHRGCETSSAQRTQAVPLSYILTPQICHGEKHDQCLHARSRIKIVAFHPYTTMPCLGGRGLFVRRTCIQNEKHDMRGWELHQKSVAELMALLAAHALVENLKQLSPTIYQNFKTPKDAFQLGDPIHACPRSLTLTADHPPVLDFLV